MMKIYNLPGVVGLVMSCTLSFNNRIQAQGEAPVDSSTLGSEHNVDIDAITDTSTRLLLKKAFSLPGRLAFATLAPDGKQLFFGSFNPYRPQIYALSAAQERIKVQQLDDGKFVEGKIPRVGVSEAQAFSPDGKIFATASNYLGLKMIYDPVLLNQIRLWDTRTWRQIGVLQGHPHSVNSIAFSPDGKKVISGNDGGGVIVHDVATRKKILAWCRGQGMPLRVLAVAGWWKHANKITPFAVVRSMPDPFISNRSRDIVGCTFATQTEIGDFEIWDVEANQKIKDLKLPRPIPPFNTNLTISPNGHLLAFLTQNRSEADEFGKPYYATIVDWENEQWLENKIHSNLFVEAGYWNVIKFLSSQPIALFENAATDSLSTIDVSALSKQP